MLPMQKPVADLIGDFRLRVLGGEGDPEVETALAILAETLRRQGYQSAARGREMEARRWSRVPPAVPQPGADLLMVLDEGLLDRKEALAGVNPDGILVVATRRAPGAVRRQLRWYSGTVATVDAQALASTHGGAPALAALGAAARVAGFVDPETLGICTWVAYDRELPYAAMSAVRTLDAGWEQVAY
ncbi:MAG: 2-oxoacid:acceptor oxidoreductase family protein [Firmicutes bacterium]|nr:2-oxoacid:acceptor oxidoreductase family protein [Bacillota bacterium]